MDDTSVLPPDPRDGYLIRKQVEYYFSDENLPYDNYLLARSHGPENLPVPIKSICEFKKMQVFKPYEAVVAALKRSTSLLITEDEGIKRKVPLSEALMAQARENKNIVGAGKKSRTKKKKGGASYGSTIPPITVVSATPGMTKGMLKPTGFEAFFADAPMKPEEFEEERGIYLSRMEIAIQRYKSKRKFHQGSAIIFNRWLRFGGIDVGQKQFTGNLDQNFLDTYDAAEISLLTATHYVGDKDNPDEWAVDFEGVAKAFLSTQVPTLFFGYKESEIRACANVMRNFYNYLLHHDVCPEYRADIEAARKICDIGERELPVIQQLGQILPGHFNVALSALSGGYHQFELQDCQSWDENAKGVDIEETSNKFKRIVEKGIEAYKDQNLSQKIKTYLDSTDKDVPYFQCLEETQIAVEVIDIIIPPSNPSTEEDEKERSEIDIPSIPSSKSPIPNPLGKLICQSYDQPTFETYDLPLPSSASASASTQTWSKQEQAQKKPQNHRQFEFLVDNAILEQCFVGLKMEVTVRKLEIKGEGGGGGGGGGGGSELVIKEQDKESVVIEYLDNVRALYCSFYTLLPNDLMMHWKEPEWLTSEKDVKSAAAEEEEAAAAAAKIY